MSLTNIICGRRGLGCMRNPEDGRDFPIEKLGIEAGYQTSASLLKHLDGFVFDQGSTNSCVANALAAAIMIRERIAELPGQTPPSRLFAYYNARRLTELRPTDTGTTIRDASKGLAKFGCCDEDFWPWSTNPITVSRRPGWNPYMMAHARQGGAYYTIPHIAALRLAMINSAIINGHPVAFGTDIAESFLSDSGPTTIARPRATERIVGRHALLITGFYRLASGSRYEVINSWGRKWRVTGMAWLDEDYLLWDRSADFTVIDGWNRIAR